MRKNLLVGALALLLLCSTVLVLTAGVGVYRCTWFVGICQGQCYCTGNSSQSIGLCAFTCDEGAGGTCSAFSWPETCTPI